MMRSLVVIVVYIFLITSLSDTEQKSSPVSIQNIQAVPEAVIFRSIKSKNYILLLHCQDVLNMFI